MIYTLPSLTTLCHRWCGPIESTRPDYSQIRTHIRFADYERLLTKFDQKSIDANTPQL